MDKTLELYGKLLKMHCFSHFDVEQMFGNTKKADNAIFLLKKQGLIASIRKNLYTAISLSDKSSVAERFEIASHITSTSFISHHSAFEFYGLANQVFYQVYVSSNSKFNNFLFEDSDFKYVKNDKEFGVVEIKHVKVTDIERTILDSIKEFEKIGGLEETIRCIELVKKVDENKLKEYLINYNNQFLFQKTGYILQKFSTLNLSDDFYSFCKNNAKKSVRYLCNGISETEILFEKEWNLCVPKKINLLLEEGDFENV